MKSQKKHSIIRAFFLLLGIFTVFGLITACGFPVSCDRGPHPMFFGKGFHPGFFNKDFSKYILARIDSGVEDLDLSTFQREKYDQVRGKINAGLTRGMERRQQFFKELQSEINSDNPDMNGLTNLMRERLKDRSKFISDNLDFFMGFYNTLDDDQKAKFMKMISKRIGTRNFFFKRPFPFQNLDSGGIVLRIVFALATFIYLAICLQVLAKKTGTKNGWMGWIPILNVYLFCKIGDKPGWWMLLFLIPFVNLFFVMIVFMAIAEARGKPYWWGPLIIVPLVNVIVPGYLAFSEPKVTTTGHASTNGK